MPKSKFRRAWPALLAGAALVAPVLPAAAVTDFQLPPSNSPRVQGPVVPGEPKPRVATPAPSPAPAPAPAPTPAPVPVVTVPAAQPSAAPTAVPSARPSQAGQAPVAAPTVAPAAQPGAVPSFDPSAQDPQPVAPQPAASAAPVAQPAAAAPAAPLALPAWWPWAAGGAALLAILGSLAFLFARKRAARAEEVPLVERPQVEPPRVVRPPVVPQAAQPQPAPPPPPEPESGPLSMALEARELTISFGAATLAYRITLTNTGEAPLDGVAISGDMVSAHASLSMEEQMATADAPLAPKHEIKRIKPGESVQVNGEFRLPMQAMHPIRSGAAALLVPLARLRVSTAHGGNGALIRTALVGQRAARPGAGLQPFRLDLGPRIYREVTQKIF